MRPEPAGPETVLRANDRRYRRLAAHMATLDPARRPFAALECARIAAGHAVDRHAGRFADGTIENVALAAGRGRSGPTRTPPMLGGPDALGGSRRHVLHVVTGVHDVGGHTRMLLRWIESDPESRHSVVLTNQSRQPVPASLGPAVAAAGGRLWLFPSAHRPTLASWLRGVAAAATLVVLHQAPADVVPIAAFAGDGGPPVAYVNHADHVFWLGSTVADVVVDLREPLPGMSRERRFARRTVLLPIPLPDGPAPCSRTEARQELGVAESQTVLLSVGRPEKYAPTATHDFYRTAGALLDRNPGALLYLVGVRPGEHEGRSGRPAHERLRAVGPVLDPTPFLAAADIYLESFPFGSQTATLEATLFGLPVVPALAPPTSLLATHDPSLAGLLANPTGEAEYLERVDALVRDPEARLRSGREVAERVRADHTGEGWRARLRALYEVVEAVAHCAMAIPEAPFLETTDDVAIAEWQSSRSARPGGGDGAAATQELARVLTDAAYHVREAGDLRGALGLLRLASNLGGWSRARLIAAVKILPRWILRRSWWRPEGMPPCPEPEPPLSSATRPGIATAPQGRDHPPQNRSDS